jgi:TM2 domain-containing membrane protein YozV
MISDKKRSMALVLCLLLGLLGGHRFYVRKSWTAILQMLTLGLAGTWTAIDFIFIACGAFKDKKGKLIKTW